MPSLAQKQIAKFMFCHTWPAWWLSTDHCLDSHFHLSQKSSCILWQGCNVIWGNMRHYDVLWHNHEAVEVSVWNRAMTLNSVLATRLLSCLCMGQVSEISSVPVALLPVCLCVWQDSEITFVLVTLPSRRLCVGQNSDNVSVLSQPYGCRGGTAQWNQFCLTAQGNPSTPTVDSLKLWTVLVTQGLKWSPVQNVAQWLRVHVRDTVELHPKVAQWIICFSHRVLTLIITWSHTFQAREKREAGLTPKPHVAVGFQFTLKSVGQMPDWQSSIGWLAVEICFKCANNKMV